MRNLLDTRDRDRILERLSRVRPDAPRRWGRMDAHQMVCHLADAFRTAVGERPAVHAYGLLRRTVVKWYALYVPVPWPKGYPAPHEVRQGHGGTRPEAFDADIAEVTRLIERFARADRDFEWNPNPVFGPLSDRQWGRWAYLHTDHHLRQFGV